MRAVLLVAIATVMMSVPAASATSQVCAKTPVGYVDVFDSCDPNFSIYTFCIASPAFFPWLACADHSFDGTAHCRGIYAAGSYSVHCNGGHSCTYYEDTNLAGLLVEKTCDSWTGRYFAALP